MRLLSFFVFTELLYLTLILREGEIVMGIDNLSPGNSGVRSHRASKSFIPDDQA
jgi:hypothetical protein